MHCVQFVMILDTSDSPKRRWTCTKDDCSNCKGVRCKIYTLTVSTEGTTSDPSLVSDCRNGNTVKLIKRTEEKMRMSEIAIIAKQGETPLE